MARPDKIYETHVVKISITIMARLNPCRWRKFHREVNYFKEEETSETPVVHAAHAVMAASTITLLHQSANGRQIRVGNKQTI